MRTEMPSWITTYWYSIGTINEIKLGECDRTQIRDENPNYMADLFKNVGVIAIPEVVGVYQEREPARESAQNREVRMFVYEMMNKVEREAISIYGIEDNAHPDLIHIGYRPAIFPLNFLVESLDDRTKRIALSHINSMPDFFQKDQVTLYEILFEESKMIGEDPSRRSSKELYAIMEKFAPRVEELAEKLKPFGLTRKEYVLLAGFGVLDQSKI